MTPKELAEIMDRLEKYYKTFYQGMDKKEVFAAWFDMFKEDAGDDVKKAAIAYICTQSFPPTVAGLKTIMADNRMAGQMTEMEAWGRIRKAVDAASGRNEAITAFAKLPSILQKIVYDPSQLRAWHACSEDTLEGVIASNIQRSYRELAKREAVYYAIPGQLQQEQAWRVEAPTAIALPQPEKQMTHEERMAEMDQDAKAFREKYIKPQSKDMTDRVADFVKPMTHEELRMFEASQKRKEALRLERMRA